jgi:hypothetical protein
MIIDSRHQTEQSTWSWPMIVYMKTQLCSSQKFIRVSTEYKSANKLPDNTRLPTNRYLSLSGGEYA